VTCLNKKLPYGGLRCQEVSKSISFKVSGIRFFLCQGWLALILAKILPVQATIDLLVFYAAPEPFDENMERS
jgi:hypothetical protein